MPMYSSFKIKLYINQLRYIDKVYIYDMVIKNIHLKETYFVISLLCYSLHYTFIKLTIKLQLNKNNCR